MSTFKYRPVVFSRYLKRIVSICDITYNHRMNVMKVNRSQEDNELSEQNIAYGGRLRVALYSCFITDSLDACC